MVRNGKVMDAVILSANFKKEKAFVFGRKIKNDTYTIFLSGCTEDNFESRVAEEIKKAIAYVKSKKYEKIYVDVNSFVRKGNTISYTYSVLSDAMRADKDADVTFSVRFTKEKNASDRYNRIKREFERFSREREIKKGNNTQLERLQAQKSLLQEQISSIEHELTELQGKAKDVFDREDSSLSRYDDLRRIEWEIRERTERLDYLAETLARVEQTALLLTLKAPSPIGTTTVPIASEMKDYQPEILSLLRSQGPDRAEERKRSTSADEFRDYLNGEEKPRDNISKMLREYLKNNSKPFNAYLSEVIDKKGLTDPQVYKRSGISKETFHKIMTGKVKPKRQTVAVLAIGMEMSEDEAEKLYEAAGYKLGWSEKCDVIIRFFIERGQYDIETVNDMAVAVCGHPLIGESRTR